MDFRCNTWGRDSKAATCAATPAELEEDEVEEEEEEDEEEEEVVEEPEEPEETTVPDRDADAPTDVAAAPDAAAGPLVAPAPVTVLPTPPLGSSADGPVAGNNEIDIAGPTSADDGDVGLGAEADPTPIPVSATGFVCRSCAETSPVADTPTAVGDAAAAAPVAIDDFGEYDEEGPDFNAIEERSVSALLLSCSLACPQAFHASHGQV